MNTRVKERVGDWSSRPFSGGHDGLRDLSDEDFSGVVETAEGPWLCLLNGRVVGLFGGGTADVAEAEGTAYEAPDPSLPLLFAMWERGGTLEEQYYTKDTPISEADATLSSGSFSGYIELSDNVLSGDYYLVYYGDRSMSVAFVGSSDRLVTGDEAFDRADDEVGIYDVYSVDLTVTEIPGSTTEDGADAGPPPEDDPVAPDRERPDAGGAPGSDPPGSDPASSQERDDPLSTGYGGPEDGRREARDSASDRRDLGRDDVAAEDYGTSQDDGRDAGREAVRGGDDPGGSPAGEPPAEQPRTDDGSVLPEGGRSGSTDPRSPEREDAGSDPTSGDRNGEGRTDADSGEGRPAPRSGDRSRGGPPPERSDRRPDEGSRSGEGGSAPESDAGRDSRGDTPDARRSGEDGGHRSERPTEDGPSSAGPSGPEPENGPRNGSRTNERRSTEAERGSSSDHGERRREDQGEATPAVEDRLRERVRQHEATIERLQERLAAVESDRENRAATTDRLRTRVENVAGDLGELRRTVMRLDRTVERIEGRLDDGGAPSPEPTPERSRDRSSPDPDPSRSTGDSTADGPTLSAAEALAGTTLLVRYSSQGDPTLKTAHAGEADRSAVDDNLRLETKTSFEDGAATVDGRPFREFLADRLEYRCFEWLVRDLVYEIRDTGNADALRDLYDAVPRIDRAEFGGEVVPEDEETDAVTFDLVVRDDRENPLVAMNFHESRDPASAEMVEQLQTDAEAAFSAGGLNAAFLVTTCYFDGAARESAESATGGRLLSRNSKKGYVSVSRKRGFHLCLVDVSDGDFHLKVPEL